jgi:hypothetical protein
VHFADRRFCAASSQARSNFSVLDPILDGRNERAHPLASPSQPDASTYPAPYVDKTLSYRHVFRMCRRYRRAIRSCRPLRRISTWRLIQRGRTTTRKIYSRELVDALFAQAYCRFHSCRRASPSARPAAVYLKQLVEIGLLTEMKVVLPLRRRHQPTQESGERVMSDRSGGALPSGRSTALRATCRPTSPGAPPSAWRCRRCPSCTCRSAGRLRRSPRT